MNCNTSSFILKTHQTVEYLRKLIKTDSLINEAMLKKLTCGDEKFYTLNKLHSLIKTTSDNKSESSDYVDTVFLSACAAKGYLNTKKWCLEKGACQRGCSSKNFQNIKKAFDLICSRSYISYKEARNQSGLTLLLKKNFLINYRTLLNMCVSEEPRHYIFSHVWNECEDVYVRYDDVGSKVQSIRSEDIVRDLREKAEDYGQDVISTILRKRKRRKILK